jgi:polyhydroxyalkanoate synthesis repressor PhaR
MPNQSDPVILKKYANRRLYDTEKSTYITLNEVAGMVKQGRWVQVTDVETGEDVTAFTLTQIVMEEAKKKNALLPVPLLHLVIRYGEVELSDFFGKYLEKMIKNYLAYKHVADEQFSKWLEIGAEFRKSAGPSFSSENPLQSFFKQFFTPPAPDKEPDKKPDKRDGNDSSEQ